MSKFTKFTFAPDGRLVYLNSGTVVRGRVNIGSGRGDINMRGYTVINKRVYYKGRLQGYVSKPNKKQSEVINKRAQTRRKRAEREAFNEFVENGGATYERGSWDAIKTAKRSMDSYRTEPYSFNVDGENFNFSPSETGLMNFASVLDQAVELNIIDIEEANDLWDLYKDGTEQQRSKLWDDINSRFDEIGYEIDSPPLFGEVGRMLGIDVTKWLRRWLFGWVKVGY